MVKCGICTKVLNSVDVLKLHLKCAHQESVLFRYNCGEDGCSRSFDSWKSYRSHLVKFHKCLELSNACPQNANHLPTENKQQDDSVEFEEVCGVVSLEPDITVDEFKLSFEKSAEILVAKLYKSPIIPRNFVQTIIDDVDNFIGSGFLEILQRKVLTLLSSPQPLQSSIDDVLKMFEILKDPFSGLSTDYRRMVHFQSSSLYVPPVTYTISENHLKVFKTRNGPVKKYVRSTGQFIPLRHVLKYFFELPGALSETVNHVAALKSCSSDVVSNIIQCQLWKRKTSKFQDSDVVLPLNFYFDEFESNAALGPHSEKLGAGYVQIPVLPPSCQSKLENILLALLFDADDRKADRSEIGKTSHNREVFAPLIKEFNFLETEGVLCQTEMGEKRIFFVLALVIGDNLGVHGITGFAEGFSANFPCTVCRAPKELTRSITTEDKTLQRDFQNYAVDIITNDVSLTGIKEECVFNAVHSFHVIENKAVDAMHDGPEGICHYVMIPILKHCVDAKYFNIDTLNSRMALFDFGPKDSENKPPCISNDFHLKSKLKFTAAEMFKFVRLLGVFVGDLIPESDEHWQLYRLHRQLMEILQARHLPSDVSKDLALLVKEHHLLYMKLTSKSMPPKFHYLLHYPQIFECSGPFCHFSSMRCEAKHRDLKNYTNVNASRRNLPLSAAVKHQLGQCFRFASKSPFVPETVCGPGELIDIRDHPDFYSFKSSLPPSVNVNSDVQRVNWVDFKGTRYESQMVLIVSVDEFSCLKFGKVVSIFLVDSEPMFICKLLNNIGYCDHVGGFEVLKCKLHVCVLHKDLYDFYPLYDFMMSNGERFVILNHYL